MRSLFCLGLFLIISVAAYGQTSTATYTLTFESTWSETTHPDDFPPNPHFSGLIGGAHNSEASVWMPGELASPGIESMAETGSKTLLEGEVNDMITAGTAFEVISGGGIPLSPGSVSVSFDVNTDYPLVSVVSMVAPSPDWFVGVYDLSLYESDEWIDELEITLYVYDSGTDSGTMYTSPDEDTQPPEPIFLITGYPFVYDNELRPVGTFEFVLDKVVDIVDETPIAASLHLSSPRPNPTSGIAELDVSIPRTSQLLVEVFDLLGRR
ncbi:MAG: spondin domain-containing protein, partial [Rubricoccaceae bacterium]|nr:spondin domain-containing protein [Rubricoccaceae bacterium]